MKRLFAILLCFAMLLPMGTVAQAEQAAKKTFSLVNWEDSGIDTYDTYENVYYTPYFWCNGDKLLSSGTYTVSAPSLDGSGITGMAAALKEKFDKYPEGARYVNFSSPIASPILRTAEYCFQGNIVPMVSEWVDKFMAEYKRIGGKLDGIISDVEYLGIYAYYIYHGHEKINFSAKSDPLVYKKIVEHPEYQEKIRPMLVERGFKFYSPVTEQTPEIFGIHPNAPAEYANCDEIWDTVMQNYQAQIVTECCEPVWKYFPDAVVNDYTSKDIKPWITANSGGIRNASGNAGNEMFYSTRPAASYFKDGNKPLYKAITTRVDAVFTNTDYNRFLYEANLAKNIRASADDMLTWWVAHAYYNKQSYNAYYSELIYHLGLQDPEVFLGYIMRQDCVTNGALDGNKYKNALKIVDQCLEQLNKVAGYADRKAIVTGADWNHEYVLSGMYAGGKNIWRLTPDNNVISLEDFQVKDAADPTFTVNGETITFPGGKIIEDDEIYDVGTYGFWIETAADVTPVVTRVADYFRVANPTYQETFEGYEVGTEWNFTNALPATVWENKKVGNGTAIVIADPANADNQLVEVKGNYGFKLVKLPQNVRAGDTYAERQAWEVTVTLPSDMADDDELILLNIVPEKRTAKDKGIKIAGTKVYYDNAGEFVELTDVSLTAGGKYTIVRELNFTTADAFTYNLCIYDAEGKEVAKVKKIPLADQNIPVYALGMTVKNATGDAVLLDDFRIYPTKTTADFYTYNTTTGMKVEEGKTEAGNVAYRLSWLNTDQTEKSYTVMAAYYDGETKISEEVVKEVKLPANGDGVLTGIVENKQEGKQLLVYLKDNNPAEEEDDLIGDKPADEPVDDDEKTGPDTTTIIIIAAAAAAVVIAVVVIVIVASSKKKKKAVATEEIIEETTEENTEE